MQRNRAIGVTLIALGLVALAYQGFTYTTRENAIDLGPLQVTTERTRRIPIPPIVGTLALVGGVVVLVLGKQAKPLGVAANRCRPQASVS